MPHFLEIHNFNKDFVADLLDRKEEETHKQEIIMNKMAVNGGNETIFQEKSDAAEIQKKPVQAARQDVNISSCSSLLAYDILLYI